jgi:hypothetical protein
MISGNFTMPSNNLDEKSSKKWEVAKAWNIAMKENRVLSPSDIKGIDEIRDILRLEKLLCPYQLSNESALKHLKDEEKTELRTKAEADIMQWLEKHSF